MNENVLKEEMSMLEKLKELYKAENIYLVEPDEDNKE